MRILVCEGRSAFIKQNVFFIGFGYQNTVRIRIMEIYFEVLTFEKSFLKCVFVFNDIDLLSNELVSFQCLLALCELLFIL